MRRFLLVLLTLSLTACLPPQGGGAPLPPATTPPTGPPGAITPPPSPTAGMNVTPPAAPSQVPTEAAAPTTAPSLQGVLFGPFHLPEDEFAPPFTGAFRGLSPDDAAAILDAARAAGFRLIIHLAGGNRSNYQEADGAFSLSRFKAQLDAFSGFDFAPYVADGTVMGHMMFDEPFDPSNWNGAPVPFADIEAAAEHSKRLWPTMPVGVGAHASFLQGGAPWSSLDFAYAQYTTNRGEVNSWARAEVEAARQANLGLVFGINILGGNNRSWVTAEQLRTWGLVLISEPSACGLLMWRYDPAYLQDPSIAAALAEIGQAARQRMPPACRP